MNGERMWTKITDDEKTWPVRYSPILISRNGKTQIGHALLSGGTFCITWLVDEKVKVYVAKGWYWMPLPPPPKGRYAISVEPSLDVYCPYCGHKVADPYNSYQRLIDSDKDYYKCKKRTCGKDFALQYELRYVFWAEKIDRKKGVDL